MVSLEKKQQSTEKMVGKLEPLAQPNAKRLFDSIHVLNIYIYSCCRFAFLEISGSTIIIWSSLLFAT
jgi:hypothetical protein